MSSATTRGARAFEWWMLANFAVGAGYSAFVSLLIPPFVNEVTGDAAAAGVVMAIIALGAVLGPALGTFADKYGAHRLVMVAGVAGMALAFVMYAISAENQVLYALDAIVMGVGIAAVSAVGPVFIVGAKLDRKLEARQLTTYSLMMPAGQLVGGLVLAAVTSWSYSDRFWLAAAVMGGAFAVVWLASAAVSRRLADATDRVSRDSTKGGPDRSRSVPLRAVLLSGFGVYMAVLILSSVANNGVNSQIANIMPNVYGMSEQMTSTMIGLAGLLNIVLFFPAGRWMGSRGGFSPFTAGIVARFVAGIGMAVVGATLDNAVIMGAGFMQLMYNAAPFVRLAQPNLAVRYATFPPGAASGWVIASSAIGAFLGSLLGGFLADQFGYNSVNWMAGIAAGASVAILWFWLRPIERRVTKSESTIASAGEGN